MMTAVRHSPIPLLLALALVTASGCGKEPEMMTTDSEATSMTTTEGSDSATTTGTTTEGTTDGMTTTGLPTTAAETETETGCSFIDCEDGGGGDAECDIWAQDCPEGEKCMPYANDGGGSWNATRCSPVAPNPGQSGDECTVEGSAVSGIDDCDLGLLCWYVNEENIGSCLDMCTGSEQSPICPSGSVCDVTNDGVLTLCLPTCDPLLVDCPEGQICFFSSLAGDFICDFDASGDGGAYGDPCEFINVCDPGLFCAAAEGVPGCQASGCCSEYCDITAPNTCSGADQGQTCVPWFEEGMAPPGLENVGACYVMA